MGFEKLWTCCYCGPPRRELWLRSYWEWFCNWCWVCTKCGIGIYAYWICAFCEQSWAWYGCYYDWSNGPSSCVNECWIAESPATITILASDHERDADIEPRNTVALDYRRGQYASNIAERGIARGPVSRPFCVRQPRDWKTLGEHLLDRQHRASDQHQFPKAANHRVLCHLHPRAIAFKGTSLRKHSESSYQRKNILIHLVLVAYPSCSSAALASMTTEAFHQQVTRKETCQNTN